MNPEFYARGKRKDNGQWVYGAVIVSEDNEYYMASSFLKNDNPDEAVMMCLIPLIPDTVGVHTGVIDAFVGDIIQYGDRKMYIHFNGETLAYEMTEIGVPLNEVNHLTNTVSLAEINLESCYGPVTSTVIGNIWDNADMVEEARQERAKSNA